MARRPVLRIWLLGGFRVELDGRPVADAAWRRNRARAVVKVLALEPGHRLHREQVMELLWPDLDATAAGANLRKAVHFARAALSPTILSVRGEILGLEADVTTDVADFEAAAVAGRLEAAIDLYAGDLLPGDRFEPWAEEPRERLRQSLVEVLRALAERQEAGGDLDGAMTSLDRLVATDPLDEAAIRRLMTLHAASGGRHLALRQYRQLETALREDLGLEPAPETVALFEAIATGAERIETGTPPGAGAAASGVLERRLVTVVAVAPRAGGGRSRAAGGRSHAGRANAAAVPALRSLESWGGVAIAGEDGGAAVFGLPHTAEDDIVRAVRAGLEVAGSAAGPAVGIATGEVVVAVDAGARAVLPPDAAPLRLARQLAEQATAGSPLLSERTARAVGRFFRLGPPAAITGDTEMRAVPVLGSLTAGPGDAAEAALVGRATELGTILGFVDEVIARGAPRLVVASGAAGLGKSRLVREVARALASAAPGVRLLQGRSLPGGRGGTYGVLADVLRAAAGISLTDRPDAMERRLRAAVATHLDELSAEDRSATVAALAMSAGIRLAENPLDAAKPDEVSRALAVAWPRFAAGLAAAGPVVLVLEDLHWASPELLEMIEAITGRSSGPLLILATTRPEIADLQPGFGASVDSTTIALRPLSDADSADLVGRLAGPELLDAGARGRILDRAEGNPLFLEQLTAHFRDAGVEGFPDTLQSLLGARLDALAPADRRLLQEASVIGRSFWVAPLEAALPGERVGARLALLERKRFVFRRPRSTIPGHEEHAFRHALLHDVAYRSLPRERRARAHARAGAWLEAIAGDRADEVGDLLALHFEAAVPRRPTAADAEIRDKAIDYLVRAGDAARRRFALDRAVDLHRRALGLAHSDDQRIRALEAIADDHEAGFHGDDAEAAYQRALDLARGGPRPRTSVPRLARKLAWLMAWNPGAFRSSPDPDRAEVLVEEGLAGDPAPVERGWLLLARGSTARLYRGSEPFGQGAKADPRPLVDRVADVDAAVAMADELGAVELAQAAGHARGMLYGLEGRFGDMLELARAEVARIPDDASDLDRSDALRRLAVGLINIAADYPAGVELGRRSRVLAGSTNPHQLLHTLWPIMAGLFQLGRFDEVAELADETLAAFRREPATECQFVRDAPVIAAAALAMLGKHDQARRLAALPGDPLADLASASAWQARFATIAGRPEDARAIAADKALEVRTYGPQHAYALVEALEAVGDWPALEAAVAAARPAVAGNAALRPLLDRAAGRALVARGDLPGARRLLRRAAAGFDRLGMTVDAARAGEALQAAG